MKQKLCIAAKPSWISLMIFNWEPYCFFLSSVVAKYDSGDLTPESNCVDILLCENPSKLLFWLRLWPLSFPLCKSQLNLPTALWGGKKMGGNSTGMEQQSIYPLMIVGRRENGPRGSMYSTWRRASCGFTDRFNYNMAHCCRGDGPLLTCCFPKGEEVSQPPVPAH